ncbi:uncharacterized protein LOC115624978 [Scaptodrosophila lebanonensis]|uniref:Uncharacterized protein LOC115624978 n=1 Tax=Drosophila lebanonensis TaxID=7225 RepID=A0A6J2TKN6_DROLE|nr:uncharacterized protein LOC115624978 [Scaptodrosophila lebanonensis]
MDHNVQWRYFEQLSFLKDHIKPRSTNEDCQVDFEVLPSVDYENQDSNLNNTTELPKTKLRKIQDDDLAANLTEYTNETFSGESNSAEIIEIASGKQNKLMENAHAEFLKVMGLLEDVLKKKIDPENDVQNNPSSASHLGEQDPFYKYLESILNRVDEFTRSDIQLKILNFANAEVKNAGTH